MKIKLLILLLLASIGATAQSWTSFGTGAIQRRIVGSDTTFRWVGSTAGTYVYGRSDFGYSKKFVQLNPSSPQSGNISVDEQVRSGTGVTRGFYIGSTLHAYSDGNIAGSGAFIANENGGEITLDGYRLNLNGSLGTRISNGLSLLTTPTTDTTPANILTWDATTKEVKKIDASSLGGSRNDFVINPITPTNVRNDAGTVVKNGNELIVAYSHFEDNPDDDGDASIFAAKSIDNGKTWGTPFELIPKISFGSYLPSFYKKSNGNILCVFFVLTDDVRPYNADIYKIEFNSDLEVVSSASVILTGSYYSPSSDRLQYDEINDRLIYPYSKYVSGNASSTTSVYEGRILVSSNEGTTWADAGLSFGSDLLNGDGFGGALEPGAFYNPSINSYSIYFRTILGDVYFADLSYGGGYSVSNVRKSYINVANARSSFKYDSKSKLVIGTIMDILDGDYLDYQKRKSLQIVTSSDAKNFSRVYSIDRVFGTNVLNEPSLYIGDGFVNINYSKSPEGDTFELNNLNIPVSYLTQYYENPKKSDLTLTKDKFALLNFNNSEGSNIGYIGLDSETSDKLGIFSFDEISIQSGEDKPLILGNRNLVTDDYTFGILNGKHIFTDVPKPPSFFENATNYVNVFNVLGSSLLKDVDVEGNITLRPTDNLYVNQIGSSSGNININLGGSGNNLLINGGNVEVNGSIRASSNNGTPTAVVRNEDIPFENYLASGTGASTTITIPHGLTGITATSKVIVQPLNAASAGVTFATIGSIDIVINYTIAPVAGTNNLNYSVLIKK